MSTVVGQKLRFLANQTGEAVICGKPRGRGTYPSGTQVVIVEETPTTLTCRVLGTDHTFRFIRQTMAAHERLE